MLYNKTMNSSAILTKLKSILKPYESGLHVKTDDDTTYYLEYKPDNATSKPEMFAAVMVKKNYVSMYYMPVYNHPELLSGISQTLKKHMQGKSCFNFVDENDRAIEELDKLVKQTAEI